MGTLFRPQTERPSSNWGGKMTAQVQAHTIQPKISIPTRHPELSRSGVPEHVYLNVAVSLARRALGSASLQELEYVLTNDTRSIVFFDRCSLIIHFEGRSRLSATSNEPTANSRTQFANMATELAKSLAEQAKPVLVYKDGAKAAASSSVISEETIAASRSFLQCAGSDRLVIIPLLINGIPIGHLVMEFFQRTESNEHQIQSILDVAPFLSSALLEKLVFEKNPNVRRDLGSESTSKRGLHRVKRYSAVVVLFTVILCAVSFIPVSFTVGGEAEIVSDSTQFAFCRVDGTVKEVLAREGEEVELGTLLARLDSRELDFQTTAWRNQVRILDHEISRLIVEAAEKPSILADKRIVEVKRQAALNELDFVNWKKQQLDIRSPIRGIILTRELQSLVGKRYRAGESFIEVVNPDQLQAAIYVPDTRISYVAVGMPVDVYLNNAPTHAVRVCVDLVAPMAEQTTRGGNVFRVTAGIPSVDGLKIGIKGVGRINVGTMPLWKLIRSRFAIAWNELTSRL